MRNPFKSGTSEAFFFREAGFSYDPKIETPAQGRRKCAVAMADAERRGSDAGLSFGWESDPYITSADFSDEEPAYALWTCVCRDASGVVVASLCGIDFGRDVEPWGQSYRRVVEAELAAEAFASARA